MSALGRTDLFVLVLVLEADGEFYRTLGFRAMLGYDWMLDRG